MSITLTSGQIRAEAGPYAGQQVLRPRKEVGVQGRIHAHLASLATLSYIQGPKLDRCHRAARGTRLSCDLPRSLAPRTPAVRHGRK